MGEKAFISTYGGSYLLSQEETEHDRRSGSKNNFCRNRDAKDPFEDMNKDMSKEAEEYHRERAGKRGTHDQDQSDSSPSSSDVVASTAFESSKSASTTNVTENEIEKTRVGISQAEAERLEQLRL